MILVKKWNDKRARGIAARLFQSAADIIPEHDKGILRVRILGSARDSDDVVATELLEELNHKKVVYPEPNLQLVANCPRTGHNGQNRVQIRWTDVRTSEVIWTPPAYMLDLL